MFYLNSGSAGMEALEMTRLAATTGATPEETLETAEAVPNIEGVDINDGWIIDHTQQLDAGNNLMKYAIMLPGDPVPFECTPFQVDQRRDMIKLWMGAVRAAIVERAGAAAAATRAAALKARRDKQMAGGGIQISDKIPTAEEAAQITGALKAAPADPAIADAIVHARRESRTLEMQKPPEGEADLKTAKKELAKAKANVAYWQAMIGSLQETEAEAVVHKASETRAGKLVRTLQTSAVAT
jgi:hypothetical protein